MKESERRMRDNKAKGTRGATATANQTKEVLNEGQSDVLLLILCHTTITSNLLMLTIQKMRALNEGSVRV